MARPALRTLATIGIFSVLSYSVARRTHEIGVRMALGAERGHVLNLMLAMGAKLVLSGLAIGLGGSFLLARYLKSAVFEVPVTDLSRCSGSQFCLVARVSSPACSCASGSTIGAHDGPSA